MKRLRTTRSTAPPSPWTASPIASPERAKSGRPVAAAARQAEDLVADVLLHHFCWRLRNEEAHYEVQSSQPLEARRREAIRRSFDDYEFAETVVASSGWDHDGQDTYKRAVFLEQGGNPSRQVTFYVEFKPLSDEISAIGDR